MLSMNVTFLTVINKKVKEETQLIGFPIFFSTSGKFTNIVQIHFSTATMRQAKPCLEVAKNNIHT